MKIIQTNEPKWLKPDPKFIKLNVDETFVVEEGVGAMAAIIRHDKGTFLATQCKISLCNRCDDY